MGNGPSEEPTPTGQDFSMKELAGEGEWVKLRTGLTEDGKPEYTDFLILPLFLTDVDTFTELQEKIADAESKGEPLSEMMVETAHLILKQAYPNIKKELVGRIVSLQAYRKMTAVASALSGIPRLLEELKNVDSPTPTPTQRATPEK